MANEADAEGSCGHAVHVHLDILLVRMTTDQLRPPQEKFGYRNALTGLWCLTKQEGLKGLYRGLGTNTVSINCYS